MSFDTIRFKLLNLSGYGEVAKNLINREKVTLGGMRYKMLTNSVRETKQDEYLKAKLTSASYEINFSIDITQNHVVFEFSMPKYIYGHNLEHYPPSRGNEHQDLEQFFFMFFKHEFKLSVRLEDIQIERLDICWNYSFESLENKEIFKKHVGDLMKSHFGEHAILSYSGNDTTMYKTQDYSFKIYDKGKEFLKHDYNKIHKEKGRKPADELAEKASYIMRAELTFRKRKISYDFFQNLSRTTQVGTIFRGQFKEIKKHRDACLSLLEKLAKRLNNYITRRESLEVLTKQVMVLNDDKYHFYCQAPLETLIATAKRIKTENPSSFKEYTSVDLNFLLKRNYLQNMARYNKIVAPKPIRMKLKGFDKAVAKSAGSSKIELDENLLTLMLEKFFGIYTAINNFQTTAVSPLLALHYYENDIKALGIQPAPLRKYFTTLKSMSHAEMLRKKIYSRSALHALQKKVVLINEVLSKKSNPKSLTTVDIPEKMTITE